MTDKHRQSWNIKSGFVKDTVDKKLKAFNAGNVNLVAGISRKEVEDMKKRKEEEEVEEVYKEFVETFERGKGIDQIWIKGGLANAGKNEEKTLGSKIYKPASKLLDKKPLTEHKPKDVEKSSSSKKEKSLSKLELFKQELKVAQEERQERKKMKQGMTQESIAAGIGAGALPTDEYAAFENDTTTNISVGNINPTMNEEQMCEVFGKYGPLASVKIMWPRTEEGKVRGKNYGYVAFMNRKDAERAFTNLHEKVVMNFVLDLRWGKTVPIPLRPMYIPPALSELVLPPPPSGLPFNAQASRTVDLGSGRRDDDLSNYVVKVVIPMERPLLCAIHRMVEFVAREGPMFEAMIMSREVKNPMFRFLFENQSPAHVYYRWKLFSILQGDSQFSWRTDDFYMFKGGSLWRPPQKNPFVHGMPEELVAETSRPQSQAIPDESDKRCTLTDSERTELEYLLRELTMERSKIADCMVWCLDHAECAEEIVECIAESLSIGETPPPKKIARLFLVSDLLHNSSSRVPRASFFRTYFENVLPEIFKHLYDAYAKVVGRLKAEQFKHRVVSCFRAWEDRAIYPSDFLINLQNLFFGLVVPKGNKLSLQHEGQDSDIDGVSLEELDGIPIENKSEAEDGAGDNGRCEFAKSVVVPHANEEKSNRDKTEKPSFVLSKWETVDECELESQAMTVSKWEMLDRKKTEGSSEGDFYDEDEIDGRPIIREADVKSDSVNKSHEGALYGGEEHHDNQQEINETKRAKLREIELKVVMFQDELESQRNKKSNLSVSQQVNEYRQNLLEEMEFEEESLDKKYGDVRSHDVGDVKRESEPKSKKSMEEEKDCRNDRHGKDTNSRKLALYPSKGRDDAQKKNYKRRSPGRSRSRTPKRCRSRSESRSPSRCKKQRH